MKHQLNDPSRSSLPRLPLVRISTRDGSTITYRHTAMHLNAHFQRNAELDKYLFKLATTDVAPRFLHQRFVTLTVWNRWSCTSVKPLLRSSKSRKRASPAYDGVASHSPYHQNEVRGLMNIKPRSPRSENYPTGTQQHLFTRHQNFSTGWCEGTRLLYEYRGRLFAGLYADFLSAMHSFISLMTWSEHPFLTADCGETNAPIPSYCLWSTTSAG